MRLSPTSALTLALRIAIAMAPSMLIVQPITGFLPTVAFLETGLLISALLCGSVMLRMTGSDLKFNLRNVLPSIALLGFVASVVVSTLRAPYLSDALQQASSNTMQMVFPYMFTITAACIIMFTEHSRNQLIQSVVLGAAAVPVVMLLFDAQAGTLPQYLSDFAYGIRVQDTKLVVSPNVNALIGAVGAACSLLLLIKEGRYRYVLGIAAGVFYVAITQSKGLMISLSFACVLMFIPRAMTPRVMRLAVIFWVVSAPVQIWLYDAIGGSVVGEMLVRSEASYLGVGTGRTLIWTAAFGEILSRPLSYLFGTGYLSAVGTSVITAMQQAIGPGDIYDLLQRSYSLHNAALQYLFDTGISGLFCLVIVLFGATSRACFKEPHLNALILLLMLSGWNEAAGTIYSLEAFFPFFGLIAALSFSVPDQAPEISPHEIFSVRHEE